MVLQRSAFKVVHSKTGADLTRSVLMQVITEQENEGHESLLTNRALEELIRFYGDDEFWELYDLQTDPEELHDLSGDDSYQLLLEELKTRLNSLKTEYQVPLS